jgi:micrococcal nuclease
MRSALPILAALVLAGCQLGPTPTNTVPIESPALSPKGDTRTAIVTAITDGDTVHVLIDGQEFRIRYIGIDAPEIAHDNNPGEPLGQEATQANADLVDGATVILERDTSDTDQFGRLLRYVWLHSATNPMEWTMVNHELALQGMADVKSYPPDTFWQGYLQQAEDEAKAGDRGIWAN